MTKKRAKVWEYPDFQLGLGLGIVSLLIIYYSSVMPSAARAGLFKASSYPLLLAVPLLVMAAGTLLGPIINRKELSGPFAAVGKEALATILGAVLYVLLIRYLGFYLSNTLYVAFLLYLFGERRILQYILFPAILSVIIGVIFKYFFGVSLPIFLGGF